MPRILLTENNIPIEYKNNTELQKRRAVLKATVEKLSNGETRENLRQKALQNHNRWLQSAVAPDGRVAVIEGDWGEVTQNLSKKSGKIYAVLNMANAFVPGGGYLEGMMAQEENMFRRTDCHFHVADKDMNDSKTQYLPEMTNLINAKNGRVYLDDITPRLCIKGKETAKGEGYADLGEKNYFLFYELRAAADDLRPSKHFSKESMQKKIRAQLETLRDAKIRHVVLSAFGCGAFRNPADKVAEIYREELEKLPGCFDEVVFAIYYAGYGPKTNFDAFYNKLNNLNLKGIDYQPSMDEKKDILHKLANEILSHQWDITFGGVTVQIDSKTYCLPANASRIYEICTSEISPQQNEEEEINQRIQKVKKLLKCTNNDGIFKRFLKAIDFLHLFTRSAATQAFYNSKSQFFSKLPDNTTNAPKPPEEGHDAGNLKNE